MAIIITVFLGITVLWLCYWAVVRPVILDSVVNELYSIRDKLEWAIIQGHPDAQTRATTYLLKKVENPELVRYVSIGAALFISLLSRSETITEVERSRLAFESCPEWIKKLQERHQVLSLKAALANSPFWWVPVAGFLLASVFSVEIQAQIRATAAKIDEVSSDKLPSECFS